MKKITILAAVIAAAAVLSTACGKQPVPETTAAAETTAASAETPAETTAAEPAEEEIRGVIVDGAMHTILVQTEQGELLEFSRQTDVGKDPDLTGLKEGILIGNGVLVTGTRAEDGTFTALKLEDADIACSDPDAMQAAIDILFSFRAKNMETLADRASYPLTVGNDKEFTSEDEFTGSYPDGSLFTDPLVNAVTGADLTKAAPKDGKMTIPEDGASHIVVSLTDDGWALTEIVP